MESRGEACELQQLVSSDVEGEGEAEQDSYTVSRDEKVVSPGRSLKVSSSGETSQSSVSRGAARGHPSSTSRLTFVNEKSRVARDYSRMATPRPRNHHKGNSTGTLSPNLLLFSQLLYPCTLF